MAQQNNAVTAAQNPNVTETDQELMVNMLSKYKDLCALMVKSKYCTKTDAQMLRKVYSSISFRVNQYSAF